jgi:hypothetical protein
MRQPNDTAWTLVHGVAAGVHHAWLENERANLVWEPQRNACARLDQWRSLAEAIYLGRWNQREAAHVIREQGWHYGPRVEYETTEVADTGTVVADATDGRYDRRTGGSRRPSCDFKSLL